MLATSTIALIIAGIGAALSGAAGIAGGVVSAKNAKKANETNIQLAQNANSASAIEAQKDRDFVERMSNTAHQREAADLQALGFNPAVTLGSGGAPVMSTSAASQSAPKVSSLGDYGLANVSSSLQSLAFMSALTAGRAGSAKNVPANAAAVSRRAYKSMGRIHY